MAEVEVNNDIIDSNVSTEIVNEDTNNDVTNLHDVRVEEVVEEYQMEVEEHNLNEVNINGNNRAEFNKSPSTDYCVTSAQNGLSDTTIIPSEMCVKETKCPDDCFQSTNVDNSELQSENAALAVSRNEGMNCENIDVDSITNGDANNMNSDVIVCEDSCQSESVTKGGNNLVQSLEYIFENVRHITEAWTDFAYRQDGECFLKGCKWSPDGTCLLSNSEDRILRLFELPLSMYNCRTFDASLLSLNELSSVLKIKEGGIIYDYCWYPLMSSQDPDTCHFLSTSQNSPMHLWDAYTGKLQATYRAYDNFDEVMSALSIAFNISGTRIYSGFQNTVKIFNTDVPGRDCDTISIKADQPGIVSCIAVNPTMEEVFAIGTFRKTVGLYTDDGDTICILKGQTGGLSHLMFSPDGNLLYTGARKDNEILCWDLRNTTDVLIALNRVVTTNQRIYFDITEDGKYLVSGSTDGVVRVWDVNSVQCADGQQILCPVTEWKAHNDCVNGISIHKQIPVVATSSGQRHISEVDDEEDDDILVKKTGNDETENMIKLWWCGHTKNSENGMM